MHTRHLMRWATPLGLLLLAFPATSAGEPFRAKKIAEDVHLFRPTAETGERTNSLVVERADGLLVVDAQPTVVAARELLAAIDKKFSRPVRYLILSNSHAESAGGASAFPESAVVLASRGSDEALADDTYDFGAEARAQAGDAWVEPPRRRADVVVYEKVVLTDARQPVELLALPRSHSPGDMLVRLSEPNLLHVGALLDANPYAADANLDRWIVILNGLAREGTSGFITLRGPLLTVEDLRRQRDAMAWLVGQVEYGFVDRPPIDELRRDVLEAPGTSERFDTDSAGSFLPLLVDRAIEEAAASRRKRGSL